MQCDWWAEPGQSKQNAKRKEVRRAGSGLYCFLETKNSGSCSIPAEVDLLTGPHGGSEEGCGAPDKQVTGLKEKVSETQVAGTWALWPGQEARLPGRREQTWGQCDLIPPRMSVFHIMFLFTESQG